MQKYTVLEMINRPPPELTIACRDEFERAKKRIAQLDDAKRGSIEEAERTILKAAVDAWLVRPAYIDRPGRRKDERRH